MATLSALEFADLFLRSVTIGLLLTLAALCIRDVRQYWPGRFLILSCFSLSCLIFGALPYHLGLPDTLRFAIRLCDVPNTIAIWLFVKSLLDEKFKMGWQNWTIAGLWCIPVWAIRFDIQGYFDLFTSTHINLLNLFALALFIYLIFYALSGVQDDLVEQRRRFRFYFVLATICFAIIAVGSELLLTEQSLAALALIKTLLILPLVAICFFWLSKISPDHITLERGAKNPPLKDGKDLVGKDRILFEKLRVKMEDEVVWKDPNLKIPHLARQIGTTEHTLRALINQRLGYRNFSDFLNQYRIEAVKTAFADPNTFDTPILSIALESGFNSLPPFNRAFKNITGQTPTEYRKTL